MSDIENMHRCRHLMPTGLTLLRLEKRLFN